MTRVMAAGLAGLGWRLALACGLAVVAVAASIGLLSTSGYLISRAALQPPVLDLSVAIVGVRFFALARAGARYAERLASHDVALRLMVDLRTWLYQRLEPLLPGALVTNGDLLQRLVADVDAMQDVVIRIVSPPIVALAALPLALLVLAPLGRGPGTVVTAAFLGAAVLVPAAGYAACRDTATKQARAQAALAERLVEAVASGAELAMLDASGVALDRAAAAEQQVERRSRRMALVEGLLDATVTALTGVAVAAVLAGGATAVIAHEAGGPLLAAGALAALAVFEAAQAMPGAARRLTSAQAAAARLTGLPAPARTGGGTAVATMGPLRLEDVWFRYREALPWVLRGATCEIRPGERVALVGPSGGGKSTIALLMSGFLAPTAGRITLAGADLADLDPATLRPLVCLCAQDAHVFNTTLAANVRVARPAATAAEVEAALAAVQLLDWVRSLPEGLATRTGDDGGMLSGGQRQRLAVARALLADARLVILDEPTANLDEPTATALMTDVLRALERRTVLLITHRQEGLESMHRVLELRHEAVAAHAA